MSRARVLVVALFGLSGPPASAAPYTPPPADQVPGYFATVLPCKVVRPEDEGARASYPYVECKNKELEGKSLRELTILRNTIYARYGWDGFRKPWLRDHFHAQPWFKPNPSFSYKLVSDVDRKNAHLIARREQSLSDVQLGEMKEAIWKKAGGKVERLSAEDKIELGLISRALGSFALDTGVDYEKRGSDPGLDQLLKAKELRQLSMRDLRLLRNTIYARRGRAFKSQILRDHFAGMSWYKLDPAYSDARLSKTDQRNIALIKSVENEFGGPLSDEDWLTEPATDGA
jgi:hypothetical protein